MDFFRRFTVLIAAPAFDADDLEGHRLEEITAPSRSSASRSSARAA